MSILDDILMYNAQEEKDKIRSGAMEAVKTGRSQMDNAAMYSDLVKGQPGQEAMTPEQAQAMALAFNKREDQTPASIAQKKLKRSPMQVIRDLGIQDKYSQVPEAQAFEKSVREDVASNALSQYKSGNEGTDTNIQTMVDAGDYSGALDAIKSLITSKGKNANTVIGYKMQFDTPENREMVHSKLDAVGGELGWTESMVKAAHDDVDSGLAYDVNKSLGDLGRKSQTDVNTAVIKEGATRSGKVQTAGQVASASEQGKANGETASNLQAIPGFEPIPNTKITDESVNKVKTALPAIQTMHSMIDDLINKYDSMGSVFTGDDAADYTSKITNLQLFAKGPEMYGLGVIAGPDMGLLDQALPNPASIKEGLRKNVIGNTSVKLRNFKNTLDLKADKFVTLNGFRKKVQSVAPKQRKVYNPSTGGFDLK